MSRSHSIFSEGGSSAFDDNQSEAGGDTDPLAKMIPVNYHIHLAEEQMCEPECIELLHQYGGPLKRLFAYYSGSGSIRDSPNPDGSSSKPGGASRKLPEESFKNMLQDLHLFPSFVQSFSLSRHISITQDRRVLADSQGLDYDSFVEVLCRIAFVYLNTYGNNFQQSACSKHKMLWLFAVLSANLPQKLGSGLKTAAQGTEEVKGPDSLWYARASFNISTCPLEDLVFYTAMHDGVSFPAKEDPGGSRRNSTCEDLDFSRMSSPMSRDG